MREAPTEYQVKAVFLYNFAKFIEWPSSAFARTDTPFVIGVVGTDPFGSLLDETVRDQSVGRRPMVLRRFNSDDDFTRCQILFIGRSEEERLKTILERTASTPVLTVTELDHFPGQSGIIDFVVVNENVRFDINEAAAARLGLNISSKLLNLARRVVSDRRAATE